MSRVYQNQEEAQFADWLTELKEEDYILEWSLCEEPFELIPAIDLYWMKQLKTKVKSQKMSATRRQTFLPDFYIKWSDRAKGILVTDLSHPCDKMKQFISIAGESYIDIKGTFFGKHDSDVRFALKQALFLQRYNHYIQKCSPFSTKKKKGLFEKTFAPKSYLNNPDNYYKRGERKGIPKFQMKSIEEWQNSEMSSVD